MSKKQKISYLRDRIMCDIQDINVLLDLITSYRVETFSEVMTLANIALTKGKHVSKNNEKIGKLLNIN
jgi:hypothetical protein